MKSVEESKRKRQKEDEQEVNKWMKKEEEGFGFG